MGRPKRCAKRPSPYISYSAPTTSITTTTISPLDDPSNFILIPASGLSCPESIDPCPCGEIFVHKGFGTNYIVVDNQFGSWGTYDYPTLVATLNNSSVINFFHDEDILLQSGGLFKTITSKFLSSDADFFISKFDLEVLGALNNIGNDYIEHPFLIKNRIKAVLRIKEDDKIIATKIIGKNGEDTSLSNIVLDGDDFSQNFNIANKTLILEIYSVCDFGDGEVCLLDGPVEDYDIYWWCVQKQSDPTYYMCIKEPIPPGYNIISGPYLYVSPNSCVSNCPPVTTSTSSSTTSVTSSTTSTSSTTGSTSTSTSTTSTTLDPTSSTTTSTTSTSATSTSTTSTSTSTSTTSTSTTTTSTTPAPTTTTTTTTVTTLAPGYYCISETDPETSESIQYCAYSNSFNPELVDGYSGPYATSSECNDNCLGATTTGTTSSSTTATSTTLTTVTTQNPGTTATTQTTATSTTIGGTTLNPTPLTPNFGVDPIYDPDPNNLAANWTFNELDRPEPEAASLPPEIQGGVGTELKKLLSYIGITASPTCSCNTRARIMDENGIEWCKDNIDTIVGWLREEAEKRHLPFFNYIGYKIVQLAIIRAEKDNQ